MYQDGYLQLKRNWQRTALTLLVRTTLLTEMTWQQSTRPENCSQYSNCCVLVTTSGQPFIQVVLNEAVIIQVRISHEHPVYLLALTG